MSGSGAVGVALSSPEPGPGGGESSRGGATDGGPAPSGGLRELKKQLTRDNIAQAALRLAQIKGMDMTIEEIAADAVVSPRTFSNYFSCKEEAVMSAGLTGYAAIVERVEQTPPDSDLLPAIRDAVVATVGDQSDEQLDAIRDRGELISRFPSLHPWYVSAYADFEDQLRGAVARWAGCSDTDLYPRLVAQVVTATSRSATHQWVATGADHDGLVPLLDAAFASVQGGLTPIRDQASTPTRDVSATS